MSAKSFCIECGLKTTGKIKDCRILGCPMVKDAPKGTIKGCAWEFKKLKDMRKRSMDTIDTLPPEEEGTTITHPTLMDIAEAEWVEGDMPPYVPF